MKRLFLILTLLISGVSITAPLARAESEDLYWNGVGVYSDAANWTGGNIPDSDDYIHIQSGELTLDTNREAGNFEVMGNAILNLGNHDFLINGDSSINSLGAFNLSGGQLLKNGSSKLTIYKNDLTGESGTFSGYGSIYADIDNSGRVTAQSGQTLNIEGAVSGEGSFNVELNGIMEFKGVVSEWANFTLAENGIIRFKENVLGGNFTVAPNGEVVFEKGLSSNCYSFQGSGTMRVEGDSLDNSSLLMTDGGSLGVGNVGVVGSNFATRGGGSITAGNMNADSSNFMAEDGGSILSGDIIAYSSNFATYGGGAITAGNMNADSSNFAAYSGGAINAGDITAYSSNFRTSGNGSMSFGNVNADSCGFMSKTMIFGGNVSDYQGNYSVSLDGGLAEFKGLVTTQGGAFYTNDYSDMIFRGDVLTSEGLYGSNFSVFGSGTMRFEGNVINQGADFAVIGDEAGRMIFQKEVSGDNADVHYIVRSPGEMLFKGDVSSSGRYQVYDDGTMTFEKRVFGDGIYTAGNTGSMIFKGDIYSSGTFEVGVYEAGGTMNFNGLINGNGSYYSGPSGIIIFNNNVSAGSGASFTVDGIMADMIFGPSGSVGGEGSYYARNDGRMLFEGGVSGNAYHYAENSGLMWFMNPVSGTGTYEAGANGEIRFDQTVDNANSNADFKVTGEMGKMFFNDVYGDGQYQVLAPGTMSFSGTVSGDGYHLVNQNGEMNFTGPVLGNGEYGAEESGTMTFSGPVSGNAVHFARQDGQMTFNGEVSGNGIYRAGENGKVEFYNTVINASNAAIFVVVGPGGEMTFYDTVTGDGFYRVLEAGDMTFKGTVNSNGVHYVQNYGQMIFEGEVNGNGQYRTGPNGIMKFLGPVNGDNLYYAGPNGLITFSSDMTGNDIYELTGGGKMVFEGDLTLGPTAEIHNTIDTYIDVYGDLINNSESPAGFVSENLELSVYNPITGTHEIVWEAEDYGQNVAGLDDNFAIGNLVFGDDLGGASTDLFNFSADSIIYCYGLSLLSDASLNLNGATIYYLNSGYKYNGILGTGFNELGTYAGGNILPLLGGEPIPEPASLLLLGFGVAGIAVFRRRMS